MKQKLTKLFLICVGISCVLFCRAQEVTFEGDQSGVIMLSVYESNVKKKEALPKAVEDAFFQIMFRGIPGSKQNKRALLGTNENINNLQQKYYNELVQGRMYSFVVYSELHYYKKKEAIVKLSINMDALISDLEKNNLYKRFGLY